MSKYVKLAEETGDRYLAALEQGQENFLKYVAAMNQWTPRPAGAMAGMFAMRAFASASFEFSERCLQQQKAFSEKLFGQVAKPKRASAKAAPTKSSPAVTSSRQKTPARSEPAPAEKS